MILITNYLNHYVYSHVTLLWHHSVSLVASSYKVKVYTGKVFWAGTDAKVKITVYTQSGKCGPACLKPKDGFHRDRQVPYLILK